MSNRLKYRGAVSLLNAFRRQFADLVEDDNNYYQASVEHEDLYATTEMLLDNDTN